MICIQQKKSTISKFLRLKILLIKFSSNLYYCEYAIQTETLFVYRLFEFILPKNNGKSSSNELDCRNVKIYNTQTKTKNSAFFMP